MIWFTLFIALGICCVVVLWYLVCRFYLKDTTFDVILENKKKFLLHVLVVVCLVTALCVVPLYKTAKCSTRGSIQKVDATYSWVLGKCLGQTVGGAYMDMDLQRGMPTDGSHITN